MTKKIFKVKLNLLIPHGIVLTIYGTRSEQVTNKIRDCHDRDRMIVGIKTTYAISAFHHGCYEFESRSGWGVQHYVIKFVSDFPVFSTYKTEGHDITEILLKVALNAIKQTNKQTNKQTYKIMRKIYKKKREKKEKC